VPGWARNQVAPGGLYRYSNALAAKTTVAVNGRSADATPDALGYVTIDRAWATGDSIDVVFPIDARTVVADDRVHDDRGRVAVERGPIVYCVEAPEATGRAALDVRVDPAPVVSVASRTPFAGSVALDVKARRQSRPDAAVAPVTLIPYHVWANRGAGEMAVWLPVRDYVPGDVGPAGGFIFFVNPNVAADGWRYLEAAPADLSAGAKWGCFRTAIAGARGTAIGTGRQNTRDMLVACADRGTAADLAATYTVNGVGGWFLPSRDELALMYRNLKAAGTGDFLSAGLADNFTYWASSQDTADMAVHIDFADNGRQHSDDKDFPRRVRVIRAF
jgi:hypothetical protein